MNNHKRFEADFASLNTGKTVTVCASCMGIKPCVPYHSTVIAVEQAQSIGIDLDVSLDVVNVCMDQTSCL